MHTANEMAMHVSSILGRHYPGQYQEHNGLFYAMLMELVLEAETAEKRANTNGCKSTTLAELAPLALKEICDAIQAKGLASAPHDKREVDTKSGKQEAVWWTMDRGIASLIRRYDFCTMSFLATSEQFLRDRLYQNWPAEDLERSYTILKSRAFHGKVDQEGGLDEEWIECDAEAQVWVDSDNENEDDDDGGGKDESSDRRQQSDSFGVDSYLRGLVRQHLGSGGVEVEQHHRLLDSMMQHIPQSTIDTLFSSPHTIEDREKLMRLFTSNIHKAFELSNKDEGLQDVGGWLRGIVQQCLRSGGRGVVVNEQEVLDSLIESLMEHLPPEFITSLQMPQTKRFRDETAGSLSAGCMRVIEQVFPS